MHTATLFVAECLWPNVTRSDVNALVRRLALHEQAEVERVGTTLVPEDDVVFVWFSAQRETDVRDACLRASVPFDRVVGVEGWPAVLTTGSHPKEKS